MRTTILYSPNSDTVPRAIDTFEGTESEACVYAFLLAKEHAERIDVPVCITGYGGWFVTNNGSTVVYTAAI